MAEEKFLEVENKLRASVEEAKTLGCKLIYGGFGSLENKKCCLISSLILGEHGKLTTLAARKLEITINEVWAIAIGFDSAEDYSDKVEHYSKEYFDLGRKFRIEYQPVRYNE